MGSGYGDPLERDPETAARDVAYVYVTADAPLSVHGVAVQETPVDQENHRIAARDLAPEFAQMYRVGLELSARFVPEFREFWGLPDGFEFERQDQRE